MFPLASVCFGLIFVVGLAASAVFAQTGFPKTSKLCAIIAVFAVILAFAFVPKQASAQDAELPDEETIGVIDGYGTLICTVENVEVRVTSDGLEANCDDGDDDSFSFFLTCPTPEMVIQGNVAKCAEAEPLAITTLADGTVELMITARTPLYIDPAGEEVLIDIGKGTAAWAVSTDATRKMVEIALEGGRIGWVPVEATSLSNGIPSVVPFNIDGQLLSATYDELKVQPFGLFRRLPGAGTEVLLEVGAEITVYPVAKTQLDDGGVWVLVMNVSTWGWVKTQDFSVQTEDAQDFLEMLESLPKVNPPTK